MLFDLGYFCLIHPFNPLPDGFLKLLVMTSISATHSLPSQCYIGTGHEPVLCFSQLTDATFSLLLLMVVIHFGHGCNVLAY